MRSINYIPPSDRNKKVDDAQASQLTKCGTQKKKKYERHLLL